MSPSQLDVSVSSDPTKISIPRSMSSLPNRGNDGSRLREQGRAAGTGAAPAGQVHYEERRERDVPNREQDSRDAAEHQVRLQIADDVAEWHVGVIQHSTLPPAPD